MVSSSSGHNCPSGLTTAKLRQCPESVFCGPRGLFQKPCSSCVISATFQTLPPSLHLHPPFTNSFPPTGPQDQPGCVLELPPVFPGALMGGRHSMASAAALHLDPCAGTVGSLQAGRSGPRVFRVSPGSLLVTGTG